MVKDCSTVWETCLEIIRPQVNEKSFKTWFAPIKPIKLENSILTIQVPHKFFYEWIEEHYINIVSNALTSELGGKARLNYQFVLEKSQETKSHVFGVKDDQLPRRKPEEFIKNPFVYPGIKKLKIKPQLNENYRFDNYIEGDCNRMGRAAGKAISEKPGKTSFNPLVLYGDVGLGKTHLAQAIGNEVVKNHADKNVIYVTMEKFTNQLIQSIKNSSTLDFVNFYQMVDVLIVDDIQFLAGKEKTQDVFFNLFNHLHQSGKQIILTSDKAPKDLEDIQDRLLSRFKWGLIADLQIPDYETRLAILEAKMSKEGIDLPGDVTEIICMNIKNNIRELEGVLIQLIAQASLNQKEIDVVLAKEVIQSFVNHIEKEITIENIKKLVASHYNFTPDILEAKSRKQNIVEARHLSMYLAKKLTDKTLKNIGKHFGGRDHSTVLHACNAVEDHMETNALFLDTVNDLRKKVSLNL